MYNFELFNSIVRVLEITVTMKGSTLRWTMKVSLWTFVMVQLCALSLGLKDGEEGVCPTSVTTFVFEYKSQRTVCRKPSIQCNTSEYKAQHPPRGYKCCKKKQTKTIVKPVCCVGWKWQKVDDDGKEKCLPICSPDCYNGRCVKPDKCECDAPLVLVSSNVCVSVTPVCDTPCFNGNCIANNTCKCNENYKVYNETHCEKECETGYTNDPVTLDCVPKCDESCLNGMCTSPNNCTCFDGYRLNDTSRSNCSPICKECDHGNCIAPDHCECHEGYKKENGRCVPVCDSPCQNGVCLAPNICACNAGYEKNHKNKFECLPMCYPNCVNASCVYPNMCSCHTGYKTTGNSWICEPKCDDCEHGDCVAPGKCICRHGFAKKNSKCEPICDKPCLNGFCSAPNVCTCNINYTLSVTNKFVCEPVCEQRCVNAKCEYPNTCKCLEGHEPTKDNSICKPKCTLCDHGECVAPQKCICFDGFAKINGTCEPVCNEPCVNGFCSEPNVCTCNINYTPSVTNKFVCEPVCEQRCVNAKCESPNTCKCLEGYELTKDNSICKPKCTLCDHGECVAPQKCICFDGFAKINGTCEPVCNEPCVNGFCSEPNVCTCNINYTPSVTNKFVCEPVCEQRCVNAKCESPNTCKCLEGYEPTKDNSICKPKCTLCDHGECVAPQKCICFDGFAKINGTCEPVCNEPCVNGFCSEPNVCTCNIYYTPSVTNKFVCEPVCEQRCVNAKCESPNTCKCLEGYEPTKDNSICKPKCTLCDHGECVAPQKCICFDGFAKINGTCEPVCYEPCVNGFCSEPNVCTCNINYKPSVTNKFVCEPVCEQRCVNAKCESPNTCKCLEGHEPTKDNSICKPKCTLCDHGECVAPQDCICHHGYENKNGKCEPVCDKPCSNGFCSEPNMCTCDANFKQSSTNHSSCVPICEKNCVNATCTSPNTCTCLTGYEPTIDDHICKPKCKSCVHGECIAPDMCVCYTGYNMTDGKCKITLVNCETCNSNCSSGDCSCEDGRPCVAEETTSMAGLELTGALGGAVVLLLVILIVAIMLRIYRKRKDLDKKTVDAQMDRYGSVIYTVPDTLLHKKDDDICDEDNNENDNDNDNSDNESNPAKIDTLLKPKIINMDQKF